MESLKCLNHRLSQLRHPNSIKEYKWPEGKNQLITDIDFNKWNKYIERLFEYEKSKKELENRIINFKIEEWIRYKAENKRRSCTNTQQELIRTFGPRIKNINSTTFLVEYLTQKDFEILITLVNIKKIKPYMCWLQVFFTLKLPEITHP